MNDGGLMEVLSTDITSAAISIVRPSKHLTFSPDGQAVIFSDMYGYDVVNRKDIGLLTNEPVSDLNRIAISPDGSWLVTVHPTEVKIVGSNIPPLRLHTVCQHLAPVRRHGLHALWP